MEIRCRRLQDYHVFDVEGNFSAEGADRLKEKIQRELTHEGPHLLLNIGEVLVFDSYAISILIWIWKWLGERNGTLSVVGKPRHLIKIKTLNLEKIIKTFPSEKEFIETELGRKKREAKVHLTTQGKFKVLHIEEGLNLLVDARRLKKDLLALVEAGHHYIVADLSKVTYFYTDVLSVFVATANRLKPLKGELRLSGLNSDLMEIVRQAGVDKIMTVISGQGLSTTLK